MIGEIAWSVPPQSQDLNRPRRLVSELIKLGVISESARYFHHGRVSSTGESTNAGSLMPRIRTKSLSETAILSPVYSYNSDSNPRWVDCYDDWSLAPDINVLARLRSHAYYVKLRTAGESTHISVNTKYMANKLQLPLTAIVPNGVDANLASVVQSGDSRPRVIILGKLFSGRTDISLIREIANLHWVEQVVFCGVGEDREMTKLTRELMTSMPEKVIINNWIQPRAIGNFVGHRTFALIPHVVSDYTISQNLMKAYLFYALGVPVVCPSMLWPDGLDLKYAFLLNAGVDFETNLREWAECSHPDTEWRIQFTADNSWASRARMLAQRIK